MISKIKHSNSPSILLNYLFRDKEDKTKQRGSILQYNCCFGSTEDLIKQYTETAKLSTKCKRQIIHCSFSFSPNDIEKITEDKMREIGEKFSNHFNLNDNLWISVLHNDTPNHPHFHMAICSVNPITKKAVVDSHNYRKLASFCRQMEKEYDLESVLSPKKFLPKEQQNLPRKDNRKDKLKLAIKESLQNSSSLPEFDARMKKYGYVTERGRGIAFTDSAKVRFKGSQVGYSLDDIKNQIINNLDLTPKFDNPKSLNLSL